MSAWSVWYDITSTKHVLGNERQCGVYEIRLADSTRQAIPVGRLLGNDPCGLLGIGKSVNLSRRISDFNRAHLKGSLRHSGGSRLFLVWVLHYSPIAASHNVNSIVQFRVAKVKNNVKAETAEEALLKRYFYKFGELPPLNSTMPDGRTRWLR